MTRIARAMQWDVAGLRGARGEAEDAALWLLDRASRTFAAFSTH